MLRFALLRILSAIPTLFVVVLLAFLLVRLAPGGPFGSERVLPPHVAENIERVYHLDESLPLQFTRYLNGLLRGDLGPSYRYRGYSVSEIIAGAAPLSFRLGGMALALAIAVGSLLGAAAALRRDSLIDRLLSGFAMLGISIPLLAIALAYVAWSPAPAITRRVGAQGRHDGVKQLGLFDRLHQLSQDAKFTTTR